MARRPLPLFRQRARRALYLVREISWWSVLALIAAVFGVVIAFVKPGLVQVVAVGAFSITLAILSTKEEPS